MGDSFQFDLEGCAKTAAAMIEALSRASDENALGTLMQAITRELGFRFFALIHHDDLRGHPPDRVMLLDYPEPIRERIIDRGRWRGDPVIRACPFAGRAFLWSELPSFVELDRNDQRCLEQGRREGLEEGITVPFTLLGECMGSCTFGGAGEANSAHRQLGVTQMIGVFAFQAARRIVMGPRSPAPRPRLHPRPRDCVVLAGRGLSNKQIARALSLTPRTVDGYMTEARELFDAHGRTELVVSAIFAGEIGLDELARGQPE